MKLSDYIQKEKQKLVQALEKRVSVNDPDYEAHKMLLEDVANLTAQLQKRIDDNTNVLSDSLMRAMWPEIFRPFPSCCVIELDLLKQVDGLTVLAGTEFSTSSISGKQSFLFKTTEPTSLLPISLVSTDTSVFTDDKTTLTLRFKMDKAVRSLPAGWFDPLTLYLNLPYSLACQTLYFLTTRVISVECMSYFQNKSSYSRTVGGQTSIRLTESFIDSDLLKKNGVQFGVFQSYLEYVAFSEKNQFLHLYGLANCLNQETFDEFEIKIHILGSWPSGFSLEKDTIKLNCVPAVNLYQYTAEPIKCDKTMSSYPVFIKETQNSDRKIFRLDKVFLKDSSVMIELFHYSERSLKLDEDHVQYYIEKEKFDEPSAIELIFDKKFCVDEYFLLVDLILCDGQKPRQELSVNEKMVPVNQFKDFLTACCVTKPSACLIPPSKMMDSEWISLMGMNISRFFKPNILKNVLKYFNWSSHVRYQTMLDSIINISVEPSFHIERNKHFHRLEIIVQLSERCFESIGELAMFSWILYQVFNHTRRINSFVVLKAIAQPSQETIIWPSFQNE